MHKRILQSEFPFVMNPVRRLEGPVTLRDRALETLRNQIIDCTLPPGMMIKDEELATQLGISKTPLREALMQLSAEGLVDMPANRPKRIAPLTRRALREIHLIYQLLREKAYALGIAQLSSENLLEMEQALQRQKLALDRQNWAESARQGRSFHEVVVRAADNEELYRLTRQYTHAIDRVSIMLRPVQDRIGNHKINLAILEAVRNHQPEKASQLMLAQAQQLTPLIESLPETARISDDRPAISA